jgi:hypothetical protein
MSLVAHIFVARSKSLLGAILPCVLLLAMIIDAGLRLGPTRWLSPVRAPFARVYTPPDDLSGSLEPNGHFKAVYFGDLSRIGNLSNLRQYRHVEFDTDSLGYMNPADRLDRNHIDVLMVGDSFLTTTSRGREQTLPGQVEMMTGLTVYNAGRPNVGGLSRDLFLNLVKRLGMNSGSVIFQFQEVNRNRELVQGMPVQSPHSLFQKARTETNARLHPIVTRFWGMDGAHLFSQAFLAPLQDGRLLVNPFANLVTVRPLRNAQEIAFITATDVDAKFDSNDYLVGRWGAFLESVSDALRGRGLRFLVILAPYKLAVYGPLLRDLEFNVEPRWQLFSALENELIDRGIRVINLLPPFREGATQALQDDRYIFWRDDTHWNDDGIRIAAIMIARELRR